MKAVSDNHKHLKSSAEADAETGSANTMRLNPPGLAKRSKTSRPVLNEDMEPLGDPSRLGTSDL